MLIREVLEEMLLKVTPTMRPGTQEQHRIYLNELAREIGKFNINDFGFSEFENWIIAFKLRKKRSTFNDYVKYLNKTFKYAYQKKYSTHKLTFPLIDPKKGKIGRIYSDEEMHLIWGWAGLDLREQYTIAIECYMRKSEILKMEYDRCDFIRECFILRPEDVKTGSRTGRGRIIPWTKNVSEIMRRRRSEVGTRWVFPNPQRTGPIIDNKTAWKLAKQRAGIEGRARFHDCRGTALSAALFIKGIKKAALAEVAGLSEKTLESVYAQADVEQLREAVGAIDITSKF